MSGRRKFRKSSPRGRRSKRKTASRNAAFLHPTQVLLNGNFLTMDPSRPTAQAIALFGDQIVAVGSDREISSLIGPKTAVLKLDGATVLPGFTDCHIHLIQYGISLQNLDLRGIRSITEMKELVSARARQSDSWIIGGGWDQERFAENRYPTREDLDEASPEKPVFLWRVCGHICVVNSKALEIAGVNRATPDPVGGSIDRNEAGDPTGIVREMSVGLIERYFPKLTLEDYENAALAACEKAVEAGLTSVHCIIGSELELRALLRAKASGRLPIRFYLFIPVDLLDDASRLGLSNGFGDEWVRLGGVKIFTDGSLGARTAALEAPYSDDPMNRGMLIYTQQQLDDIVAKAHRSDLQIAGHAIGDRAITMLLDSIEKADRTIPGKNLRHRVEHASVLSSNLIRRLRVLKLVASVQPHFTVSDFWVEKRLGPERTRLTYAYSSLLKGGVISVGGSDCPVEPLAPLSGIGAAVNRANPAEALNVEDTLTLYTRSAAYASFEEDLKGTITPGKYADLVVLQEDPRKVTRSKISEIAVLMTIAGGRVVHRSVAFRQRQKEKERAALEQRLDVL